MAEGLSVNFREADELLNVAGQMQSDPARDLVTHEGDIARLTTAADKVIREGVFLVSEGSADAAVEVQDTMEAFADLLGDLPSGDAREVAEKVMNAAIITGGFDVPDLNDDDITEQFSESELSLLGSLSVMKQEQITEELVAYSETFTGFIDLLEEVDNTGDEDLVAETLESFESKYQEYLDFLDARELDGKRGLNAEHMGIIEEIKNLTDVVDLDVGVPENAEDVLEAATHHVYGEPTSAQLEIERGPEM